MKLQTAHVALLAALAARAVYAASSSGTGGTSDGFRDEYAARRASLESELRHKLSEFDDGHGSFGEPPREGDLTGGTVEDISRRLEGGVADFLPLHCNGPLDDGNSTHATCLPGGAGKFSDLIAAAGAGEVVVPCGQCYEVDADTPLDAALAGGLDVQGRLTVPEGAGVTITTPHVYVQGELIARSASEIIPDNLAVKFVLTGTTDLIFHPADSNSAACGEAGCPVGKKPFLVAGGKVDVEAMPADCPTWTHLKSYTSASFTLEPDQVLNKPVSPPAGCDAALVDNSFQLDFGDWAGDKGAMVELDVDGLVVDNRKTNWQGPTADVTHLKGCLMGETDYLFQARVMLVPPEGVDPATPTTCQSTENGCLKFHVEVKDENDYHMNMNFGWDIKASAPGYNEWYDFSSTLSFPEPWSVSTAKFVVLRLKGPDPRTVVRVESASLRLPDPAGSYVSTCSAMIPNGDAESNGFHPFPLTNNHERYPYTAWPDADLRTLVLEEPVAGTNLTNKFNRLTGRYYDWHGPAFYDIPPTCVRSHSIYRISVNVRLHSDEAYSPFIELRAHRKDFNSDGTISWGWIGKRELVKCSPQSLSDGWVRCEKEVAIVNAQWEYDNHGNGYFDEADYYRLELKIAKNGNSWTRADIDYDDFQFEFVSGTVDGLVLPTDRVAGCWGVGSEVMVASHTVRYEDSQVATITGVSAGPGGTSVVSVEGGIVPATTMDEAAANPDGTVFASEVALLSRNVQLTSDNTDGSDANTGGYFQVYHTPDQVQKISGVEFRYMGQEQNWNYPIEFHLNKNSPSVISKNSIRNSYSRCITLSGTQSVNITENVAYDTRGHCYVLAHGAEFDNNLERNLGAYTRWSANDGDGWTYYFRNPNNRFVGNVAAGARGGGFVGSFDWRVQSESASTWSINARKEGFTEFRDNVAHSNYYDGFKFWATEYPSKSKTGATSNEIVGVRAYKNRVNGIYLDHCQDITITGGVVVDNRDGIDAYRSNGLELRDIKIRGATSEYVAVTEVQGAEKLCPSGYPLVGVRWMTYNRYSYKRRNAMYNLDFAGFDDSPTCPGSVPIKMREDGGQISYDGNPHFAYATTVGGLNISDSRGFLAEACEAKDRLGVDDVFVEVAADPADPSSVPSAIVSDVPQMQAMAAFAGMTCEPFGGPESCLASCSGACARTVEFSVDKVASKDWVLRIVNEAGQSIDLESKIYLGNDQTKYERHRYFYANLPAGKYNATFIDTLGNANWPIYVEEQWEEPPTCAGHANPGDVTVIVPDPEPGYCNELIRNGDMEGGTSPWQQNGRPIEVVDGLGANGTKAIRNYNRDRDYRGVGQYIDTRCLWTNVGKQYEIKAWVYLKKDGLPYSCDPNHESTNTGCPEVTFHMRYYKDSRKEAMIRPDWTGRNPMAETVRPYNEDGYNLLHGVFTVTEELASGKFESVWVYIQKFKPGVVLFVDDFSITPYDYDDPSTRCNDLVSNGGFERGDSCYWDTYNSPPLSFVTGTGGAGDLAIKASARTSTSDSPRQDIKVGCYVEGQRYMAKAKFRMEDANGNPVECLPYKEAYFDTDAKNYLKCPEMREKEEGASFGHADRLLTYANTPMTDGWSTMEGAFYANWKQAAAEKLIVWFKEAHIDFDIVVDDLSISPIPADCKNLILNSDFEGGTLSHWLPYNTRYGLMDLYPEGADGSAYSMRSYSRTHHREGGLKQQIESRCFAPQEWWIVSADFKLLNSTGHGAMCDINSQTTNDREPGNCPSVRLYGRNCDPSESGSTNYDIILWNANHPSNDWIADEFNPFFHEFMVDPRLATCDSYEVFIQYVNRDYDIVVDNLMITPKTEAPTSQPTNTLTATPTVKPTAAPVAPTESPTSSPTQIAIDLPEVGSTAEIEAGLVTLAKADPNTLCTLTRATVVAGVNGTAATYTYVMPIARSYEGFDWENAASRSVSIDLKCRDVACQMELPALGVDERYILTTSDRNLSAEDEAARLLESATMGTTKTDIEALAPSGTRRLQEGSVAGWISDQMDVDVTPMTSHREYFRRRVNPRWTSPNKVGQAGSPCKAGSMWRAYAFTEKDRFDEMLPRYISIIPTSAYCHDHSAHGDNHTGMDMGDHTMHRRLHMHTGHEGHEGEHYVILMDGFPRTVVMDVMIMGDMNYAFNPEAQYEICDTPRLNVGGSLKVKIESGACVNLMVGNPRVEFSGYECASGQVLNLTVGIASVDPLPATTDVFVLTDDIFEGNDLCNSLPESVEEGDPPILGRGPLGEWLIFDPRLNLGDNSLVTTMNDGGGSTQLATGGKTLCANAPRTFLNVDSCTLSTAESVCAASSTKETTISLNEENIKQFHTLTGRYTYALEGLVVRDNDGNEIEHYCTPGLRSRWMKNEGTCQNATNLQPDTNATVTALIQNFASTDDNPYFRDVFFPNDGSLPCDHNDKEVGIEIQVGNECWTHIHPDFWNVYDMTYWTLPTTHPGNMVAMEEGDYNPIKKWMDLQNSSILVFPSTHPEESIRNHPILRWDMHHEKFDYVGRFGDSAEFVDLPTGLRTTEVAAFYGATTNSGGDNVLVCGSPGEVANDPSLGPVFDVAVNDMSSTSLARQRENVWTMVALEAKDQLRQRMAWALNQILVIVKAGIESQDRNTEIFLQYYDIMVRNAFGNYRDLLTEISYSALMAEHLTFLGSKSTAYMWESENRIVFADENFAREVMQLFSIGMTHLNMDGTPKLDEYGNPLLTYTNEHIMNFAKAWTGFERHQAQRGNIEDYESDFNRLDPMKIIPEWRDRFAKSDLNGGYIGDGYPRCVDLPEKMFLRMGARYRLLGSTPLPELMSDPFEFSTDPTVKKFVLSDNSTLKGILNCTMIEGTCQYSNQIVLQNSIDCTPGTDECEVDTVRVVQVAPDIHYEYVPPPCVQESFYDGAVKLSRKSKSWYGTMCADPRLPVASEACCDFSVSTTAATRVNKYDGERMTFATAKARCENVDMSTCDYEQVNVENHKASYHWAPDQSGCSIRAKVDAEGSAAIVYVMAAPGGKVKHVRLDNLNYFQVNWNGGVYPSPENNCGDGICAYRNALQSGGSASCECDTVIVEEQVFQTMPSSKEEILSSLTIGSVHPSAFDQGVFSERQAVNDFFVYRRKGLYNMHTVFEVTDSNGRTHFLKNAISTVKLGGSDLYSFRNPVHFMNLIPSETNLRDAEYETEAVLDHYFYQDSAAPFLAMRLIQRFGTTSNPSGRYIEAVATAFKQGTYASGGITFGTGKYGDLAATCAAILLDREARSPVLDNDPAYGSLREPLLKVIGLMRNMDFERASNRGQIELVDMDVRIGQMAHEYPSVFSFFLPGYEPDGAIAAASLVSPEAQVMDMPKMVYLMNGLYSLVRYGLGSSSYGFARSNGQGQLTYSPPPGATATQIVDELATRLTAGRLNSENRKIIEEAYSSAANEAEGLKLALQLVLSTAEYHSTNTVTKSGENRDDSISLGSRNVDTEPYKAVVYVMFTGGADSYNMLAPYTCSLTDEQMLNNETSTREQYESIRMSVALDHAFLHPITTAESQPCEEYGIHHSLPALRDLYKDNDLLFFANTGVMSKPVDKSNYRSETVTQLFAHDKMQHETRRVDPYEEEYGTGILGRMADALHRTQYATNKMSIRSTTVTLVGEAGVAPAYSIVNSDDITPFNPTSMTPDMNNLIDDLNNATTSHSGFFAEHFSRKFTESVDMNDKIRSTLQTATTTATFPNDRGLGERLKMVARMIKTREDRDVNREFFYLTMGGYDNHSMLRANLENRFNQVNNAIQAFAEEMKSQGVWDKVTLVETSDFARTLDPNGNLGSDHAWGGNYFMMGGAVNGGRIMGKYPGEGGEILNPDGSNGPLNVGRGRMIPTTPWDAVWHGVSQWMGITDPVALAEVCPNMDNFPPNSMFTADQLFKSQPTGRRLRG